MKVLLVNQSGQLGGGELSLLDIARHLGSRATVALLSEGPLVDRLAAAGVRTVTIRTAPEVLAVRREDRGFPVRVAIGAATAAARLARLARSHDLVYANSQKAFVLASLAAVLARRPLVWHLRDILSTGHFSPANIRRTVALANRIARGVIANSRATADAFVQAGGRASRLRVIYSGVDPTPFVTLTNHDLSAARSRLVRPGQPVVGVFGRLSPWKGQHVAVEALAALPDVHLLIVGAPLFGEAAYAARLPELADRLGVSERVSLLGARSDVPLLMGLVDIVIHTSIEPEPFGRVLVEGMLAGKPVVATRGGGAPEIVDDGVTGRLITPGDPQALAAAVRELLDDSAVRERMGESGRERATRLFHLQRTLAQITDAIAALMADHGTVTPGLHMA